MSHPLPKDEVSWYEYKVMAGEGVHVIDLQPGHYADDLYAEITREGFKPLPEN